MSSLGKHVQVAVIPEGKGAFRTSGSLIVVCGSMAAAFLLRIGMSLPAMQRDGERRLVRQDVAVWINGIDAGW